MTDSKQPGFWRTLPGVLTAVAGVITAITGLLVVLNQMHGPSARIPESERAPSRAQTSAASQAADPLRQTSDPSSSTARPAEAGSAAIGSLTVGQPGEVRFKQGTLVFRVLTAALEPFNPDTRLLNVRLRISNDMKGLDRSYYSELRAVADGLPQAPVDAPLEQIEAHSVKDLSYTFRLPAGVRTLMLRITRDEEAGEIPLHLK